MKMENDETSKELEELQSELESLKGENARITNNYDKEIKDLNERLVMKQKEITLMSALQEPLGGPSDDQDPAELEKTLK